MPNAAKKATVNTSTTTRDITAAARRVIAALWPHTHARALDQMAIEAHEHFRNAMLTFTLNRIDWNAIRR